MDFADYKDSLPKEPSSGKKAYSVGCANAADWQFIDNLLKQSGTSETNVPNDAITVTDEKLHSQTRAVYQLTDAEAADLRNHAKVSYVTIDATRYAGSFKPEPSEVLDAVKNYRYDSTVKNYRKINPALPTSPGLSDKNRAGYQLLRVNSKDDPWDPSNGDYVDTVKESNLQYLGDGSDVDVVIADTRAWFGHIEFQGNLGGPLKYRGTNVLKSGYSQYSATGSCDVLDLVLDAPYYIDPAWFDANPGSRLTLRWDGTRVPVDAVAREWWSDSSKRSAAFAGIGVVDTLTSSYTRTNCNGSNTNDPAGTSSDYHATPCMSQAYGRQYGWAFNSNKWFVNIIGTSSIEVEEFFDILKLFHQNKPTNSKYGTKDPTITSNSWGYRRGLPSTGSYYYRQGTDGSGGVSFSGSYMSRTLPAFMNNFSQSGIRGEYVGNSMVTAGDEMVEAGVIFVESAGNTNQKMVEYDHPDYDNYWSSSSNTPLSSAYGTTWGYSMYNTINRQGFPGQIGKKTENGVTRYRTVSVGALDHSWTGYSNGIERKADYSNMGELVKFYAPGAMTLAASTNYGSRDNRYDSTYVIDGVTSTTSEDDDFGGTSSACPTAAGLIATKLQFMRHWTVDDVLGWIEKRLGQLSSSDFYSGTEDTSASSGWTDDFSTQGGAATVLWDAETGGEDPTAIETSNVSVSGNITISLQ
jgi:hypothetical protein